MNDTRSLTTEVRHYQPEDLIAVLHMGARFAAAAGEYFDQGALHATLNDSLSVRRDRPPVRAWVGTRGEAVVGFLIASIGRLWMTGEPVAHELAWWVDAEARNTRIGIELLETFTRWARQVAPCAACSTLAELDPRVERLLERKGWRRAEQAWIQRWQPSPQSPLE